MHFGQLVVGPPGSGKTTYCNGVAQYLALTGRDAAIINLDPANDALPYTAAVDIANLVEITNVQAELGLGPNGGLIYCTDYLAENLDWLDEQLAPLLAEGKYLLFDLPGQVELFTLHTSLKRVVHHLTTSGPRQIRLACVQCVDAHLCSDASKYLAALLLSLNTMLHLELPHVNVLSKVDLLERYGELSFSLDYYCEVQDLSYLAHTLIEDQRMPPQFTKLTRELCEVVENFGMLSFVPLAIEDGAAVARVLEQVDKANGYVFAKAPFRGDMKSTTHTWLQMSGSSPYPELEYGAAYIGLRKDNWMDLQEQYMTQSTTQQQGAERLVGSIVERKE